MGGNGQIQHPEGIEAVPLKAHIDYANSLSLKAWIFLLIIVLLMLVSQILYRKTITSLQDSLYSTIVVLKRSTRRTIAMPRCIQC